VTPTTGAAATDPSATAPLVKNSLRRILVSFTFNLPELRLRHLLTPSRKLASSGSELTAMGEKFVLGAAACGGFRLSVYVLKVL